MKTQTSSDLNQTLPPKKNIFNMGLLAIACLAYVAYRWSSHRKANRKAWPKAFSPEPEKNSRDRVDEASWESFPASDPPSW